MVVIALTTRVAPTPSAVQVVGVDPGPVLVFFGKLDLNVADFRPVRILFVLHIEVADAAYHEVDLLHDDLDAFRARCEVLLEAL